MLVAVTAVAIDIRTDSGSAAMRLEGRLLTGISRLLYVEAAFVVVVVFSKPFNLSKFDSSDFGERSLLALGRASTEI